MENMSDGLKKILIFLLVGAIVIVLFVLIFSKNQSQSEHSTTTISVYNSNIKLEIGETANIAYTSNSKVSFNSSNPNVATVDSSGIITAISAGNAMITLVSDDRKATAYVNVTVNRKDEPLKVLNVNVESSNDLSKNYVKKDDTLIINIEFNRNLNEKPKILINNEELIYTLTSKQSNIIVEKEVGTENSLDLKVYNNSELLYTYALPKVDNEAPKCTLKEESEYLKIEGTDNTGISGFAISQSQDYSYSSTTMLKYDKYGTWYGYVRDYAGNKGSCSIKLIKPIVNINPTNITIVGDSRMYLLCMRDWYKAEKGTCVAKSAMGYNWFESTAIGTVNSLNSDKKKYIVNNLGVNDLGHIDKYIAKYEELANGSWKNYMMFLLSVNPTEGKYAYMNSKIDSFNDQIKNMVSKYKNMAYCDTNAYLKKNGFGTTDGLHYSKDTDKVIYEQIKKCIYDYYN